MDLTELKNHTLPNLTGRIVPDKNYIYGAGPHHAGPHQADPHQASLKNRVTDFMMYLFTFWKATVRLAPSISQSVKGKGKAASSMAELLKGPRLPFATVFDGVESTVWDILERRSGKWHVRKRPF